MKLTSAIQNIPYWLTLLCIVKVCQTWYLGKCNHCEDEDGYFIGIPTFNNVSIKYQKYFLFNFEKYDSNIHQSGGAMAAVPEIGML